MLLSETKVEHGQIGQPGRQRGIHIQLAARRVRHEAQHRLQQREDRAGGPGLGHVGAKILNGKARFDAVGRRCRARGAG